MHLLYLGRTRRDGKQKVQITFKGSPNMFGGFYPAKIFTKIVTQEALAELVERAEKTDGVTK